MEYSSNFLKDIENSLIELNIMIESAIKQRMLNFDMFYTLRDGLNELKLKVENRHELDSVFFKKWDRVMGWVHITFEGTPLLDLVRSIDKVIVSLESDNIKK
jgi:hypothetical protein